MTFLVLLASAAFRSSLGVMLVPIEQVYGILNFLTRDNLYTHQLPRAMRECRPYILSAYPWLAQIDTSGVSPENWHVWLAGQVARYGDAFPLTPMPDGVHEYREPLGELQEMAGGTA